MVGKTTNTTAKWADDKVASCSSAAMATTVRHQMAKAIGIRRGSMRPLGA